MPRLLLVDDNPSIHRIAESLLAPTAIELVCVDSAAEALDRLQGGERFDVAMLDTAMPGMDGWTLLERLRAMEATARMPIAMMAGVLDPVDPVKIQNAPIQGFLKKPIELRELGDRVNALLATPVAATGPAAPLELGPTATRPMSKDEMVNALEDFPEFRPTVQLPDEDVLVLGPEDLWPEEFSEDLQEVPAEAPQPVAAMAAAPVAELPELELEELDLEGLQGLAAPMVAPSPAPAPSAPQPEPELDLDHELDLDLPPLPPAEPFQAPEIVPGPTRDVPALPELDTLGAEELSTLLAEELPPLPEATPTPEPAPAAALTEAAPWDEPTLLSVPAPEPAPFVATPDPFFEGPAPAAPAAPFTAPAAGEDLESTVQAILANPALMETLTKAVVARLGEQALKEVAWEVLPDLAKKLHP